MKKKNELSFLNVFFCIMVVLIHVLSAPVTQLEKGSIPYAVAFVPWRLSGFVVQGFIFLAGVKMALGFKKSVSYPGYLKSRFFGIVIPYIIWVIIFYIYFLTRNYFEFSVKDLAGYLLRGDLVSHFYFVIIIIQFYVLRPLWKIMTVKIKFSVALIITLLLMLLSELFLHRVFGGYTDRIFTTYLIFWVCGCYMGHNYEQFKEKLLKNIKIITLAFSLSAVFEAVLGFIHFTTKQIYCIEKVHFIYCVCSVFFCVAISFCAGEKIMKCRLFKEIDSASFYIYLVHPLFIFIIDEKMVSRVASIGIELVIRTVFVYTAAIVSCIIYTRIKRCIRKKQ